MKGSVRLFLFMALMAVLLAPHLSAQDLTLPVDKTVGPGYTAVAYEGIRYRVFTNSTCQLLFSTVDREHVRLQVVPLNGYFEDYDMMCVQWSEFNAVFLPLGAGGTNSYLLGTETGYAEK